MKAEDRIEQLKKELEAHIEFKRQRDSDYPNFKKENRIKRYIALLEAGLQDRQIKEIDEGFLVFDKFIVRAQKNNWRVQGKAKTYRFRDIQSLVIKLKRNR